MSAIIDHYSPDYVLSACDTLSYCDEIAEDERELTRQTRDILATICASVEDIVEDFTLDMSDSLADLDELFDRHGL